MTTLHPLPCAPIPFWFWNGEQDEARIAQQLAEASRAGFAGLAIHARAGNGTSYLSERWFTLVRHACVLARELDLEIWIYDEADYPSGTVGNRVQGEDPELRQRTLVWTATTADEALALPELIACFRRAEPEQPCDPRRLPPDEAVLAFHVARNPCYVDTLDPRSCAAFMRLTHAAYAEAIGEHLGRTVTTIYTDDVNYHMQEPPGLGWTADLPVEFARRRGYELLPRLPALVADLPGAEATRVDFHRTLLELFLERWVQPQRTWCHEHGVRFVGHLRGDEGPMWMLAGNCGAAMPYFAAQDTPSIDDFLMRARDGGFTRRTRTDHGLSPTLLYRQAASVADQFGDGCVSSEVLASMGWGASLAEAHRHLLFEQLQGINVLTQHAVSFATAGVAKRDHPPSWFVQQPWWTEVGAAMTARQARLCGWLREGVAAVDICVVFPTTAAWACLRAMERRPAEGWPSDPAAGTCDSLDEVLGQLCLTLVRAHIPFHFADELLLASHGTVVDGRLRLGAGAYHQVLVPPWPRFEPSTLDLLRRAAADGVRIHRWGAAPAIGGDSYPDLATTVAALPRTWPALDGDVVVHARLVGGQPLLLAGNCGDRERTLPSPGPGCWQATDLASGAVVHDGAWPDAGLMLPSDACWRVAPGLGTNAPELPAAPCATTRCLVPRWQVASSPPTLAVFDRAQTPDGRWLGLRGVEMASQRPEWLEIPLDVPAGVRVTALYGEQLDRLQASLDGRPLPVPDGGHPCSPDLRRVACSLEPGRFRLRLHPSAITGAIEDLIVEVAGMVEPAQDPVHGWLPRLVPWRNPAIGLDLARQGLPFHWGAIDFTAEVTLDDPAATPWLELGAAAGAVAVSVDGMAAGCLWHAPWRLHLGHLLHRGSNRLGLRCLGSAQNLLGPHRVPDAGVWAPLERDVAPPGNPYHLAAFGVLAVPRLVG